MSDAKLISLSELARRTGLPIAWLRREADAGTIPCLRAGRLRMFDLNAVREVLDTRSRKAPEVAHG